MKTPEIVRKALAARSRSLGLPKEYAARGMDRLKSYQKLYQDMATRRQAAIISGISPELFKYREAESALCDFKNFFIAEQFIDEGINFDPNMLGENQYVARGVLALMIQHHYHPNDLKMQLAYLLRQIKATQWSELNEFRGDAAFWNQAIVPMIELYPHRIDREQRIHDVLARFGSTAYLDKEPFQL